MKPAKPMSIPEGLTAADWEAAFRRVEAAYARNKSRRWVLTCMRDILRGDMEHLTPLDPT
jgi:hypothetical protein